MQIQIVKTKSKELNADVLIWITQLWVHEVKISSIFTCCNVSDVYTVIIYLQ